MRRPDIVFGLLGDVRRNSRALRQLRTLAARGWTIDVLTYGEPGSDAGGLRWRPLPRPSGRGPLFFASVHRQMLSAALSTPARVYHAGDLFTLPAMHKAAERHGGRLVYDARELYPHVAATVGRPWVSWFWRGVEQRYAPRADLVLTVSDSIARAMVRAYSIPPPFVSFNVPALKQAPSNGYLRVALGLPRQTTILLHQGQMQRYRGCERLIDAMRDVEGAVLVFLGGGPLAPALRRQTDREGLAERVRFLEAVLPDDLPGVTASADAGITLLEDTCLNHRYALPNKLFEYLAAGLPVLASDLPEIRRVVDAFGVGLVVDAGNRPDLVRALNRLATEPSLRRRLASNTHHAVAVFDWDKLVGPFVHRYESLLRVRAAHEGHAEPSDQGR